MKYATQRLLTTLTLSACLGAALSACAPMMVGGFAMGALMATDRRTAGTQVEDEGIELRGAGRIRDSLGERGHVNITSYNRQVLLSGEVPARRTANWWSRLQARLKTCALSSMSWWLRKTPA